jgi:succinylglutamate desuccinylase
MNSSYHLIASVLNLLPEQTEKVRDLILQTVVRKAETVGVAVVQQWVAYMAMGAKPVLKLRVMASAER